MSVFQKTKADKIEIVKASLFKHTQPAEDRINSDSQNKKITNKFMN